MRPRLCGWVILAVLLLGAPARGAIESPLVRKGVAAYDALDHPRAVKLLERALRETLTREELVATCRTLAFSYVALDRPDEAARYFGKLLRLQPGYDLDVTISPRVRAAFDEARRALAAETRPLQLELPAERPPPDVAVVPTPVAPAAPWYRRAWIWGVLGALTVGAIVAAVVTPLALQRADTTTVFIDPR